jgi:hypothetical protein
MQPYLVPKAIFLEAKLLGMCFKTAGIYTTKLPFEREYQLNLQHCTSEEKKVAWLKTMDTTM